MAVLLWPTAYGRMAYGLWPHSLRPMAAWPTAYDLWAMAYGRMAILYGSCGGILTWRIPALDP